MDKWQAQQAFWESFGLRAYDENTVPDTYIDEHGNEQKNEMPYITYQAVIGSLDGVMVVSASLWYRGNSWAAISQKATEMETSVNQQIKIDGGYLKIRKPISNFAQRMDEPNDRLVRRMRLQVEMEFLTE